MRPYSIPIYLLPFLATTSLAKNHLIPRSVSIELVDSATAVHPGTTPALKTLHLDLRQDLTPYPQHLDNRQAPAPPAAPAGAAAGQQGAAPDPAAPAPAPAAPAAPPAPVAGVGGGVAPPAAQPAPGAAANPVTTVMVNTVLNGVTTQVPVLYTQTFGAAASAPSVQSGSIGMGTLTGNFGVVKTQSAKSEAVKPGEKGMLIKVLLTMVIGGVAGIGGGIWGLRSI